MSKAGFVSMQSEDQFLTHPLLEEYLPSERRAIILYHFSLSVEHGTEISVEETVVHWENGGGLRWRREKMRRDGQRQLLEIERHKYILSEKLGYDVGWEAAAADWIENHAGPWRTWWEEQPESGVEER